MNDGHAGCKGDLVCGSNNCKKFGAYYHPKAGQNIVLELKEENSFPL